MAEYLKGKMEFWGPTYNINHSWQT